MGKKMDQLCIFCGKPIPVGSRYCNYCGKDQTGASGPVQSGTNTVIYANPNPIPPFSGFCVAGFVTAIFQLSPFNLLFSIIGVHECNKYGKRGKGLGILGIILSLFDVIVLTLFFGIIFLGWFSDYVGTHNMDYFEQAKTNQEAIEDHNAKTQEVVNVIEAELGETEKKSFWDTDPNSASSKTNSYLSREDAYSVNDWCAVNSYYTDDICRDGFNNTYESKYVFTVTDAWMEDQPARAQFYTAGDYKNISGTIYVPYCSLASNDNGGSYVRIYGDDVLLYESTNPVGTEEPIDFSVDISGNSFVVIEVFGSWYYGDGTGALPYLCVTNVELSK
ncbi:MAG: hypothetical protein IK128_06930 [Clostridiales bacterium]|nr:hypothetical protein [Lachnospiraceae bacterium]MBR5358926.1 hypothetical protein [Clostridiales bacterium]